MYRSGLNHLEATIELLANNGTGDFINMSRGDSYLYRPVMVTVLTEKSEHFRHTNNSVFSAFSCLHGKK